MASLPLATPDTRARFTALSLLAGLFQRRQPAADTPQDAERALQEFTRYHLERTPEAIASEFELECMLCRMHGWF